MPALRIHSPPSPQGASVIFAASMIEAILEDRKTVTRRPVSDNPRSIWHRDRGPKVGSLHAVQRGRGKPSVAKIEIRDRVICNLIGILGTGELEREGLRVGRGLHNPVEDAPRRDQLPRAGVEDRVPAGRIVSPVDRPRLEVELNEAGKGVVKLDGHELPYVTAATISFKAGELTKVNVTLLGAEVDLAAQVEAKIGIKPILPTRWQRFWRRLRG